MLIYGGDCLSRPSVQYLPPQTDFTYLRHAGCRLVIDSFALLHSASEQDCAWPSKISLKSWVAQNPSGQRSYVGLNPDDQNNIG